MSDQDKLESGYQILNILMVENSFARQPNIDFVENNISNQLDVDSNHHFIDDLIIVECKIKFSISRGADVLADFNAKMVGSFKQIGSPELKKEDFASVNAPAIIYPYMREFISSIALRSGLGGVFIPPLNFIRRKKASVAGSKQS